MKTLIVYATKYGCTKKCTEIIKSYSKGEVRIVSAKNFKANIEQYDTVIIGGSVYMGKIQKEITHFCHRYKNKLLHKKLGLFACCYTPKETENFLESLFSQDLINHSSYATTVGGKMDYEKMNFVYRKLFQSLKKIDGFNKGFIEPSINEEEIKKLVDTLNN